MLGKTTSCSLKALSLYRRQVSTHRIVRSICNANIIDQLHQERRTTLTSRTLESLLLPVRFPFQPYLSPGGVKLNVEKCQKLQSVLLFEGESAQTSFHQSRTLDALGLSIVGFEGQQIGVILFTPFYLTESRNSHYFDSSLYFISFYGMESTDILCQTV